MRRGGVSWGDAVQAGDGWGVLGVGRGGPMVSLGFKAPHRFYRQDTAAK